MSNNNINLNIGGSTNANLRLVTSSGSVRLSFNVPEADMFRSVYDTNKNGIVDNAEKVNGFIVEEDLLEGTEQRITNLENNKVDKVAGKGLSTNDYTTDEKTKLSGIAENAEVNVNADWNATDGDGQILNKPSTFPPSTHTHDDRYFTEDEVTNALALKANKAQEDWVTPTLESGFTGTVQYRKNNFGLVEFRGYVRGTNIGTAFTLPQGYKPKDASRLFLCPNSNSATAARRIDVSGLGLIILYSTGENIYVDNIRFYGEV